MCACIQFPFYLYMCIFSEEIILCCVCKWWGVWELRRRCVFCDLFVCVCLWERDGRVVKEVHLWIICCCVSVHWGRDSLCFSLLSLREGVKIMRTWEEDALPHTSTLWFTTHYVPLDRVCALVSSFLNIHNIFSAAAFMHNLCAHWRERLDSGDFSLNYVVLGWTKRKKKVGVSHEYSCF